MLFIDFATANPLACVLATGLIVTAVCIELPTGRIPNKLTFSGLLAGLIIMLSNQQWSYHLSGLGIRFGMTLILFLIGFSGAGFVKLMSALGFLLGPIITLATAPFAILFLSIALVRGQFSKHGEDRPAMSGSVIAAFGYLLLMTLLVFRLVTQ